MASVGLAVARWLEDCHSTTTPYYQTYKLIKLENRYSLATHRLKSLSSDVGRYCVGGDQSGVSCVKYVLCKLL